MKFKSIFITLLLTLTLSLSIGSVFFASSKNQIITNSTDKDQIDTLVEDVVTTIFDKNGKVSLKIVTPKMAHYIKNNITMITTPKITIFREPDNIWHINAESAEALNGLDKIVFYRNVVVSHQSDAVHPVTMLYTSLLTVHPENQTAETNAPVSILQPGATANAIGMFANLQDGTVKLLSNAREEYVPS